MHYMKFLTAGFFMGLVFLFCLAFTSKTANIDQLSKSNSHKIDTLQYPSETHLQNVQQLTFGGDNAEAYFSFDSKWIVFQRTQPKDGVMCDQIFIGKVPKQGEAFTYKMVSTGKGRTTCGAFLKDGKHIIYASTHLGADTCPPVPDRKKDGDIDLYMMDIQTGKEKRITNTLGYDGGSWFSPDGKKIIWRASRPKTEAEIKEYKDLLAENLVAPTSMEVYVANVDGSNVKQVTKFGQANWAPYYMPDNKRIIFASNHEYKRGFPFNLYTINEDGTDLKKISHDNGFDAFPMFS